MSEENNTTNELCVNVDHNAAGDSSRVIGSLHCTFNSDQFEKSSPSGEGRSQEILDPFETVEKVGCEMKDLFTQWSEGFLPSKQFEAETLKNMDVLKNEAYMMEAEFLENKLKLIKKRIVPTD